MFFSFYIGLQHLIRTPRPLFSRSSFLERRSWQGISGISGIIGTAVTIIGTVIAAVALQIPQDDDLKPTAARVAHDRQAYATVADEPLAQTASLPVDRVVGRAFRITEPKSGGEVTTPAILIRGIGAVPGGRIQVQIFTDRWYDQSDGEVYIGNDGTWAYGPTYLRGSGMHGAHTIVAQMIVKGVVVAQTTISGTKRAAGH